MISSFIDEEILNNKENQNALKRLNVLGARFDCKTIALIMLIPFIPSSILLGLEYTNSTIVYSSVVFFIFFAAILTIIGNYFYFKTYNNYYDIFIFGLVEEDTKAVLRSIIDDYPVIKVFVLTLALAILPALFSYWLLTQTSLENSFLLTTILTFIYLIASALMIRGTIKSKPLSKIHAQVSNQAIINKMVPNGIVAINWAFKDKKKNVSFNEVNEEDGKILLEKVLGDQNLILQTPYNQSLANKKPNVIFTLMESFALNGLITDDEEKNNLLGNLRPYFKSEYVFTRFLSSADGTMLSLVNLLFNSPFQEISHSSAQNEVVKYSPFQVYKSQGYKTIFISSGNLMWRNLATYLPKQGVDECYDQNNLMDRYPEAKKTLSYWGVADEYSFKLAEELLNESEEPLFICILTITNHPPYEVPASYNALPVNPEVFSGKYGDNDKERENTLKTFQYSANALGNFISAIKSSSKGNNTIISATGDHHIRCMKFDSPRELFLAHAVPFILSIPNELKQDIETDFNYDKLGSHKDIMPTLYHASLSEAEYWNNGGFNLLSQNENYFAYHPSIWADNNGIVDLSSPEKCQYQWESPTGYFINKDNMRNKAIERIEAYQNYCLWQINYLVKGKK